MALVGSAAFGAVLAGGASRRFGSPKALAPLAGEPLVRRVAGTLLRVTSRAGVVGSLPGLGEAAALPVRGDAIPGAGALGGLYTALGWAADEGFDYCACVSCDLPFASAPLLAELIAVAARRRSAAVVPRSAGPRGVEPLCAVYSVACAAEVGARIARRELALHRLVEALGAELLPLERVRVFGDPGVMFWNVNTPDDLARAEARLSGSEPDA